MSRFWRQPSTHYRNFQLVFGLFALQLGLPALAFLVAPEWAVSRFGGLNTMLGGAGWEAVDARGSVWWYLGTAQMAALAFMCIWMQRDLRSRISVLAPLVFLKGSAGTLWLAGYLGWGPGEPVMLAAGLADYVTCLALAIVALLAHMDIQGRADAVLVPRPVDRSLLGWTRFEQRWLESALAATLPAGGDGRLPGVAEVDLAAFWPEFARRVPIHFKLGLRAAAWVVTFWPIVTFRSLHTFGRLSDDDKDEVLRAIDGSRFFLVRQLTFVLKTTTGFVYFRDEEVQREFPTAYSQPPEDSSAGEEE